MNPSARGWIDKLLRLLSQNPEYVRISVDELYLNLREVGFVYGNNLKVVNQYVQSDGLSHEEHAKLNLTIALNCIYKEADIDQSFSKHLVRFYKAINQYKSTWIADLFGEKENSQTLERIIHRRIQIDPNFITKHFNYFLTNAFLCIDVLAYQRFVKLGNIDESYLKRFESIIEYISYKILDSKSLKNEYDKSLMGLIEASLRYQELPSVQKDLSMLHEGSLAERKYLFDIACMTSWSDHKVEESEAELLSDLGNTLQLQDYQIKDAIAMVDRFYSINKDDLSILNSKNVIQNFYDNSSDMVNKLLSRNKKRLLKELSESKELVKLISKSTVNDLSREEQKQLQDQLLDIFKSIPSLAIFMLPGGAILLPLVVKFIPKLLPSAFDDNRIED